MSIKKKTLVPMRRMSKRIAQRSSQNVESLKNNENLGDGFSGMSNSWFI